MKNLWKNALKPKAIMFAKEGMELEKVRLGQDLLKAKKGNIQKVVSKQSQNILKKLLSKDKDTKQDIIAEGKQVLGNTKADLIGLAKDNRDRFSERSKRSQTSCYMVKD